MTVEPARVVRATVAAALVPGAGFWLMGRRRAAAILFTLVAAAVGLAVAHLVVGLGWFESHLGAFLFGVMVRDAAILHAYQVVETYFVGVDPDQTTHPRWRLAALLNAVIPGAGYLVARGWIRAATGFLLLVLVVWFAALGTHPFVDAIFFAMQVLMGVLVYMQMKMRLVEQARHAADRGEMLPEQPPLPRVPAAQIVILLVVVGAVAVCGLAVEQALPDSGARGIQKKHLSLTQRPDGVRFASRRLGLRMRAHGKGWSAELGKRGFLLWAEHGDGGEFVRIGIDHIPPFVRDDRYLARLGPKLLTGNQQLERTRPVTLGGADAYELTFSGAQRTYVVPRKGFAYIVMMGCQSEPCSGFNARLRMTRDSFQLDEP